jgi:hypothetical protein
MKANLTKVVFDEYDEPIGVERDEEASQRVDEIAEILESKRQEHEDTK